jgi:hypothetical protein
LFITPGIDQGSCVQILMGRLMQQGILSLRDHKNYDELLACHVLEHYGIRYVSDLKIFVSNHGWEKIAYHFKGMGPVKFEALKKLVKRSGLL